MPPNWNDGISDEVELAERIRDRRVVLEPGERRGVQVEDRVAVARDLGGVGLAMEHPERRGRCACAVSTENLPAANANR